MKRMILAGIVAWTAGLAGLYAQQPAQPSAQPKIKSNGERKAVMAIQTAMKANDVDGVIKASEDLLNNYADSDYKEWALTVEANAYHQKRDDDNAQVYAERVLQVNPKAFEMELMVGEIIAPNIKEHDLNYKDEIANCTKLFTEAIEHVKVAVKPNPQLPDADWETNRKYKIAEAHNGLGMVATIDKKPNDAVKEFQLAVDGDPDQDAYATRLASALLSVGKKDEAVAICDKLLAKPNLHPTIKQVVTSIRTAAGGK